MSHGGTLLEIKRYVHYHTGVSLHVTMDGTLELRMLNAGGIWVVLDVAGREGWEIVDLIEDIRNGDT